MSIETSRNFQETKNPEQKSINPNKRIIVVKNRENEYKYMPDRETMEGKKHKYETLYKTGKLAKTEQEAMQKIKEYEVKLKIVQAEKAKIESPYRSLASGNGQAKGIAIGNSLRDNRDYQNILQWENYYRTLILRESVKLRDAQRLLKEFSHPEYEKNLNKYSEEKRKIDEKYKKLLQDLRSRQ